MWEILNDILEALLHAAGFGALIALFIDPSYIYFIGRRKVDGRILIGTASAASLLVLLIVTKIYEERAYENKMSVIEGQIAGLLTNPSTLDQIEDAFPPQEVPNVWEALHLMWLSGGIELSKFRAELIGGKSNEVVSVRVYVVPKKP